MEEPEVHHITKNISKLIELTSCNTILLSILHAKGIFVANDLEILDSQRTPSEKALKLYLLLKTRKNAYPVLMEALKECSQTGAYEILEQLYICKSSSVIQKYVRSPSGLDDFICQSNANESLVICTNSVGITLEKVESKLGNRKAVFLNDDQIMEKIKSGSMNGGMPENVITIVTCSKTARSINIIRGVLPNPGKFVIITCEIYKTIINQVFRLEGCERVRIVEDSLHWSDLTEDLKVEVLGRTILWCRKEYTLVELFDMCDIQKQSMEMEEIMGGADPTFLEQLILNSDVLLERDLLPRTEFSQLQYYIPRIVIPRRKISKSVFIDHSVYGGDQIFLVSGVERYQLARLVLYGRTDTSRNQIRNGSLSVKFIILQLKSDFEEICKLAKEETSVHWLHHDNGTLTWVKSKGSVSVIQRAVEENQEETYEEDDFIRNLVSEDANNIPVCLSDTPGMGKTVLAANIAKILSEVQGDKLVIFLVFPELIGALKENGGSNLESVLEQICKLAYPHHNSLSSTFFVSTIKCGILKLELLLDGYDEIHHDDLDLANDCLKVLRTSARSVRLFVTTRPHLLHILEETLEVLGYNLKPFTEADQLQFLNTYWTLLHPSLDPQKLEAFSKSCLDVLKNGLSGSEKGIAGIPLQCLLIAEVFEQDAVTYANPGNEISDGVATTMASDIQVKSVGELFEGVIEKKIRIYMTRYQSESGILSKDIILKEHIHCSLMLLFEKQNQNISTDALPMAELLKVGIVEAAGIGHVPRFLHRTFAEYFVALFVQRTFMGTEIPSHLLECYSKDFIFTEMLGTKEVEVEVLDQRYPTLNAYTFKYKMIAYFLNSRLKTTDLDWRSIVLHQPPGNLEEFIQACIHDDVSKLWEFSVQLIEKYDKPDQVFFNFTLLVLSVMRSGVQILEQMVEKFQKFSEPEVRLENLTYNPEDEDMHPLTLLHLAAVIGNFSNFEFILHEVGNFRKMLEEGDQRLRYLLHSCVEDTNQNTEEQISGKIQIIRLVIRHNSLLMRMEDSKKQSPLLCSSVHIKLLIELIKCGADVMATEEDGYSVLDVNSEYLPKEVYHDLVSAIPLNVMRLLVRRRTDFRSTVLHHAVIRIDPMEETFKIFDDCGADWNAVDMQGYTPFWRAVEYERSTACLEKMIEYGADWKYRDRKRKTVLHVAAEAGNLEAVIFLFKLGLNIRARDWKGNTVLHYAVRDDHERRRNEMLKLLLDLGADINAANWRRKTVLDLGVETQSIETVQLLCDKRNEVKLAKEEERGLCKQCVVS